MCDGYVLDFKIQKPKSSLQNFQLLKMKQNTLEEKLQLLFSPGQDQPQYQQQQKRERAISYRGSDVAQRQDDSNKRTSMSQLRQAAGEQSQQQPEQQQLGAIRQHISHRRGGSSEVSSLGISEADPFQELNDQLKDQETQLQQQQKAYAAITTESLRIPFPHKHNQQQQYFQSNSVEQVNSSQQIEKSVSQSQSQQQQQQQSGRYSQIDPSTRGVYGLITHSADKNRKSPQPYLECSKSIELLENKLDGMNTRGNKLDQIRLISQHVISSIDAKETAAQQKLTHNHAEDGIQDDSKLINKDNNKKKELFNVYDSSEVAITELYNKRQRELRSSLEAQPNGSWKKYINASAESSDNKKTKKKWDRDHSNSKGLFDGGGILAQQEDKQYLQENPIGKANEAENKGQSYSRDPKTRVKLLKAKSTTDITKESKIKGKILDFGNQDKQGNQQNPNAFEKLRQQAQIPTYFKTTLSSQNKLKQKPSCSSLVNQRKGTINNEKSENYKNYNEIHGCAQKKQQRCDSSNKAAQKKTEEEDNNSNHNQLLGKIPLDNIENISQMSQPQLKKPLLPQKQQTDKKGISIHERLFNEAKKAQILRTPSSKDSHNSNHNSNGMMSKLNRDDSKKDKNIQLQQQQQIQQQQRLFSLQNSQEASDYDCQQQKENIQILKPAYFELKSHCKAKVQYPSAISRPPRLEESTHEKINKKDFNVIETNNNRQLDNDFRYHQPEHEQRHQNSDRKVTASTILSAADENLIKPYPPLPLHCYPSIKQLQLQYQQPSQKCINVSSCICGICTSTHLLFSQLDGDNDGVINVESLSLNGIQTELLLLISDLLLRVESLHQNVSFDMFYQLTSYQLRTRIAQHYQDNQVSMLHERYPQNQNNPSQVFATFQPSYQ